MKNITYLFGAGASKNALPIVKEFPERIKKFIEIISSSEYELSETETFQIIPDQNLTKRKIQIEFIEDLKWMLKACENNASVDTYAKKLYLKNDKELRKLKLILSAYLIFEQSINKPDNRYDSFFASILKNGIEDFPNQLKILSWNYDNQFEIVYSDYSKIEDFFTILCKLNIIFKNNSFRNNNYNVNDFGVFKINGTTSIYEKTVYGNSQFCSSIKNKFNLDFIETILSRYKSLLSSEFLPSLSFAWEEDLLNSKDTNIIDKCIAGTKETNILIVIGYSFPFFNREIDRTIIKAMSKLEKVYFQAPDADNLKERFLSIREDIDPNNLVSRFDTEQFLIPNEL